MGKTVAEQVVEMMIDAGIQRVLRVLCQFLSHQR